MGAWCALCRLSGHLVGDTAFLVGSLVGSSVGSLLGGLSGAFSDKLGGPASGQVWYYLGVVFSSGGARGQVWVSGCVGLHQRSLESYGFDTGDMLVKY